jgi:hypothetical protein
MNEQSMLPSITQATSLKSKGMCTAMKGTHADHAYILEVAEVILLAEVIQVIPCFHASNIHTIMQSKCTKQA